jgi:hypothetical protein
MRASGKSVRLATFTRHKAASSQKSRVTNKSSLEQASEAYALMATGKCGKVAVVFDEEVKIAPLGALCVSETHYLS